MPRTQHDSIAPKYRRQHRARRRNCTGSSTSELPVALLVLIVVLLIPLFNLLGAGVQYMCGASLNDMQLRRAAMLPRRDAQNPNGPVIEELPRVWSASGLGRFTNLQAPVETTVGYRAGSIDENQVQDHLVIVTTTIVARPWLQPPLPPHIPGVTAPFTFVYRNERPLEDPMNFNLNPVPIK